MSKTRSLGIDLGTSNCALTLASEDNEALQSVEIFQITEAGQLAKKRGMPSALYLASEGQFSEGSLSLPWAVETKNEVIGHFARNTGSQSPDRLVHSAKSWLCNPHINPSDPILPWGSDVQNKKSPVEVSRQYLEHLKNSYLYSNESNKLEDTQVVVTIPASFDEAARGMTANAAKDAGLGDEVILIEEPQAAFYAWLDKVGPDWRKQVNTGDIILVCDVGGGTSDFSLIMVGEEDGLLTLDRLNVGQHILLGGDNMDLALAYALRQQFEAESINLNDWQFLALIHAARQGKEALFNDPDKSLVPIVVPSQGSSLFAGTIKTELSRDLLLGILREGFFAKTTLDDMPSETSQGLQEFGLEYATDAVISKHLAKFLKSSLSNVKSRADFLSKFDSCTEKLDGSHLQPDVILFNGGVFRSAELRERVIETLNEWKTEAKVRELEGAEYDLSVSQGAARYGLNKLLSKGHRIRAGASHSYYIGLESSMPAIPGFKPPIKALCVVPQGMEEGSNEVIVEKEFGLMTGATVQFRFFSSIDRGGDKVGDIIPDAEKMLSESSPLQLNIPHLKDLAERSRVPVQLHAKLNELGIMELWMQHKLSTERWKLDFTIRTQ